MYHTWTFHVAEILAVLDEKGRWKEKSSLEEIHRNPG